MHLEAFELGADEPVALALARLAPRAPLPVAARAGFAVLLAGAAMALPDRAPALAARRARRSSRDARRMRPPSANRCSRRCAISTKISRRASSTPRTTRRCARAARARRRAARRRARRARRSGPGAARASATGCPSCAARRSRRGRASARSAGSRSPRRARAREAAPGERAGAAGGGPRQALRPLRRARGVDLELPQGASLAVLGANGAGKSTLLRLIAGLARPTSGSLHVAGAPAHRPAARARVGFIGPRVAALPLAHRAREPALRRALAAGRRRAALRVEQLLESRRSRASPTFRSPASRAACRSGSRSRAGSSTTRPLLLLDEPFTGLDPRAAARARRAPGGAARRRPHARARDPRPEARRRARRPRDRARRGPRRLRAPRRRGRCGGPRARRARGRRRRA